MMESESRRDIIMRMIQKEEQPVSASELARRLGVSRQIIVGDVALLRARGHDIIATARGYIIPESAGSGRFIGKLACCHSAENIRDELYIIVDMGGKIIDVIVEHDLYGEMSGQLNLDTREDVDAFIQRARDSGARMLSELTEGVHLHTISCVDAVCYDKIRKALAARSFLHLERD